MDPKTRLLVQVTVEDASEANRLTETLMGQDALPRRI
jgi:DNA gyrase/topoisomerase IV subunit B